MSDGIQAALTAVADRLVRLAAEEPPFRARLLGLLDALQAAVKKTDSRPEERPAQAAPAPELRPPEPATTPLAFDIWAVIS